MPKVPRRPSSDHLKSLSPAIKHLPAGTPLGRIYFRGGTHPTRWSEFRYVGPLDSRFDHNTVIRRLADDPRPRGVKKLTGREAWRIRVGDYRILYEIHDDRLVVVVVDVGYRRQIYR